MNFIKTIKSSEYVDYLTTGSGLIELGIKQKDLELLKDIAQSGDNANAVEALRVRPHIKKQLSKYSDDILKKEVKEIGVLDNLKDRTELEQILLWNLAWDFADR